MKETSKRGKKLAMEVSLTTSILGSGSQEKLIVIEIFAMDVVKLALGKEVEMRRVLTAVCPYLDRNLQTSTRQNYFQQGAS